MKSNLFSQHFLISHRVIPFVSPETSKTKTPSKLRQLGNRFVDYLARPPEIKVHKKTNRQGEIWWQVYDPHRNLTATFASESEVRMWLEERYYL